jgi:prepilin-type N-terminal cleavage/methylation domain-containing protein
MKSLAVTSRVGTLRRGFTLMELIVVMFIMMLMVGVGVGSFAYFNSSDPFEEPTARLQRMSKYALQTAMIQHRTMTIAFDKTGFGLVGDSSSEGAHYSLPGGVKMAVFHWGGREWEKAEGQIWPFGEQGICEPIQVRFQNDSDHIDIAFHPLTGVPIIP